MISLLDESKTLEEKAFTEVKSYLETNRGYLSIMRDVWEQFRRPSAQERNAINAINLRYRTYDKIEELSSHSKVSYYNLLSYCKPLLQEPEKPIDPEVIPENAPTGPVGEVVVLPVKEEEKVEDPCGCPLLSSQAAEEVIPLLENEIKERFSLTYLNFKDAVLENTSAMNNIIEEMKKSEDCTNFCNFTTDQM